MTYRERILTHYKQHRHEGLMAQQALCIAKYEAKYDKDSKKLRILPSRYEAYDGAETTELPNGWKIKVEFQRDDNSDPPWDNSDGHGIILDWTGRDENLDDWVLNQDRRSYRYYDPEASLKLALKDGWDSPPYGVGTKRERAMRAVKSDYEYLRRWCNDQWWYVGLIVTLLDENDEELGSDSCWGIESDSMDYLCSTAREWAAALIRKAWDERRAEALAARIDSRFNDTMENAL